MADSDKDEPKKGPRFTPLKLLRLALLIVPWVFIAYLYRDLAEVRVVNDTYDGEPIVVTFDPDSGAAAAFDATTGGEALVFERVTGTTLRDAQTGTPRSAARGRALSGPLAGTRLTQLPSFASFWFAWSDFYPETTVYQPPAPDGA